MRIHGQKDFQNIDINIEGCPNIVAITFIVKAVPNINQTNPRENIIQLRTIGFISD